MTQKIGATPSTCYGVLQQDQSGSELDEIAEQVRRLGFAILDSGLTSDERFHLSEAFNRTRASYIQTWGEARLRDANEFHTIRAPLLHGDECFMHLALNPLLLTVLGKLIVGKFILNQQNGVINPPGETYNQGAWHRDLPYQHYVSSSPLAVNALFCVDDFTLSNGSTFVLPASHKTINYPSESYVRNNALQVEANAGQFILLDCMLFHSGGFNFTQKERRAVNHVYTIPYFKQQIKIANNIDSKVLTPHAQEIMGLHYQEPLSIDAYLSTRSSRQY